MKFIKLVYGFLTLFVPFINAQTPCSGGFAGGYPCNSVDLMSILPMSSLGGGNANDIWGWTDSATGKEYALMGTTSRTVFVDVTNPVNPIYVGYLPTHTGNSSWRDIKVYNNHAYIVSEAGGHGIQIFDLTQLGAVSNPPVQFSNSGHFGSLGNGNSHNIAINESTGFAYTIGTNSICSGGPVFFDLSTPSNLTFDGCFSSDGYTHDAVIFTYLGPDTEHVGKEICIASNEDTQTIIDVTDKANPSQLSRTGYANNRYTHQGWITDDHKYLLFDDELDERNNGHNTRTHIFDISNLDAPVYLGFHDAAVTAIDHNQYVKGRYAYQANYRAGLRILDIDDVQNANLTEVAYFDVYPSSDSPNFNGAWSVYPYFTSGTVIVSHIEEGLFVLRPFIPHFVMESNKLMETICEGDDAIFEIDLTAYSGFTDMVDLSITGLPAGAIANFSNDPVSPDGTSILTVSGASTGTYSLLLNGTNGIGNSTHDVSIAFKVDPLPTVAGLSIPANNATGVSTTTIFSWSAFPDAINHTIEISTDPGFLNIVQTASNITGTSYVAMPQLVEGTFHYWRVKGVNTCGETSSSMFTFRTDGQQLLLQPKIFLGGCLDPLMGLMEDNLRVQSLLPTSQPYSDATWSYTGSEMVASSVFMAAGNDAIIDWVLVELIDPASPSTIVSTRAGLLQADGDVVDVDGVSPLSFEAPSDDYLVVIHHRNHLSVISQNTFPLSNFPNFDVDFTTIPTAGTDAQDLLLGIPAMWSGNSDPNGIIDAGDRSSVWNARNFTGYSINDVDLDGVVNSADRSVCWNHRNRTTFIP